MRNCLFLIEPFTIDPFDPRTWRRPRLNADTFDVLGLWQGSAGWLREGPYHPPCARPGTCAPGAGPFHECHEHPGTCSNTVEINNACWLTGTPNYGTYGILMRLCYDWLGTGAYSLLLVSPMVSWILGGLQSLFSLPATITYVAAYKILNPFKREDPRLPVAWSSAAWVTGPGATVSGGNRPNCICDCPVIYGTAGRSPYTTAFDYVWLPVINPIGRPLTR